MAAATEKAKPPPLEAAPPSDGSVSEGAAKAPDDESSPVSLTFEGYAEAYYQFNFNRPANSITNYRAWDNRHNTFTLSNAVLGGSMRYKTVGARVLLQAGSTPDSYYAAEPSRAGAAGAAPTDPDVFKHVQEAYFFYDGPVVVDAGIFMSPIGPESMAIKDQWGWSRSNLFFGLPAYHVGARVAYQASGCLNLRAGVYNGWNNVVDNNAEKSISAELVYKPTDSITVDATYFTGVERDRGSPAGRAWRHLFDVYVIVAPVERLELKFEVDVGFEPNNFGTSGWAAGAAFARIKATDWLYIAAQADVFYERVAPGAVPIFWPTEWVAEGAVAIDVRPAEDHLSFKLEYRHDHASGNVYFREDILLDAAGNALPNARYQDTVTLGGTAWF